MGRGGLRECEMSGPNPLLPESDYTSLMRRAFLTLFALTFSAALSSAADIDKDRPLISLKTPEFQIDMPNGKNVLLSSYKGKVICAEFLFTTCPHCQHAAQMYTKLYKEFGDQGFQPIGIAVNEMAGMLVNDFIRDFKVGYPVGFSTMPMALHYLKLDVMKRWVVPQVVVIDRKGVVRYQTIWSGDDKVQDETFMRNLIKGLIAEPSVGTAAKKAPGKTAPMASAKKSEPGTK